MQREFNTIMILLKDCLIICLVMLRGKPWKFSRPKQLLILCRLFFNRRFQYQEFIARSRNSSRLL